MTFTHCATAVIVGILAGIGAATTVFMVLLVTGKAEAVFRMILEVWRGL